MLTLQRVRVTNISATGGLVGSTDLEEEAEEAEKTGGDGHKLMHFFLLCKGVCILALPLRS
jgi:hypothetical protein